MASRGLRIGVITLSFVGFRAVCLDIFHPSHNRDLNCSGKTFIVTGATGTVGRCTAYGLAVRKARVIMACRDMDECRVTRREMVFRSGNRNIACRELDLSSIKSINEFADNIIQNEPRINGLINSAAVKDLKKRQITQGGIEMNLAVNYIGPYLLTTRLLDKLIESSKITGDSRIVNVVGNPKRKWKIYFDNVNLGHGYTSEKAYNQSKLALAMFTRDLANKMKESNHKVFVFATDPGGPISINIIKKCTDAKPTDSSYRNWESVMKILFLSPDRAAAKSIYCSISKNVANYESSGKLYRHRLSPVEWRKSVMDDTATQQILILAKKWVHLDKDVDKIV